MSEFITTTTAEIEQLAFRALIAAKVNAANAGAVARSIAAAERDGQQIVGLSYLPTYCDHAACGKVDGYATPVLTALSAVAFRVDALEGFAHPALALGLPTLANAARCHGLAALTVGNSYACGSLGYFVEELADRGLVALMFANASPSIAAFGGHIPFFGTNPLAFAVPRQGLPPLLIDQSSSVVAKVAVIDAQQRGVPLPKGWAIDAQGNPTTDADLAMAGSLLPIGGYKGASLALMVDILAAGLSGSNFSFEASSFGDCEGGPPRTGQCIIAINPALFGGETFRARVEVLLGAMQSSPEIRIPGERRTAARRSHENTIEVPATVWNAVLRYAEGAANIAPLDQPSAAALKQGAI